MSRSCRRLWRIYATLLEAPPLAADASGYRSVRLVSPNRRCTGFSRMYRSANFVACLRLAVAIYGQTLPASFTASRPCSARSCKFPKPGFFSTVSGSSLRNCRT